MGNLDTSLLDLQNVDGFDRRIYCKQRYQIKSSDFRIVTTVVAAFQTLKDFNYDIQLDVQINQEEGVVILNILGKNHNNEDNDTENVIIAGLISALQLAPEKFIFNLDENVSAKALLGNLKPIAYEYLSQIESSKHLKEEVTKSFTGYRLTWDIKVLQKQLFAAASELDLKSLDSLLTHSNLESFAYKIGLDQERRKEIEKLSVDEILAKYPELDIRRLRNEEFRSSKNGKILEKACKHIIVRRLFELYSREIEDIYFDEEGNVISLPVIPLAEVPIVEALIIDKMFFNATGQEGWYVHNAEEITETIASSNSLIAHDRLIQALTSIYKIHVRYIDGWSELDYRSQQIRKIFSIISNPDNSQIVKELLRQDVKILIQKYSLNGDIITANLEDMSEINMNSERDLRSIHEIVQSYITSGLVCGDNEIGNMVLMQIQEHLSFQNQQGDIKYFVLNRTQLFEAIWRTLDEIQVNSNKDFILRAFRLIMGESIEPLVDDLISIDLCVKKERRVEKVRHALDKKFRDPEAKLDEESLEIEKVLSTLNNFVEESRRVRDRFLRTLIENISSSMNPGDTYPYRLLELCLKKLYFYKYDEDQFSDNYHWIISLVKEGNFSDNLKKLISWSLAEQFKSLDSKSFHLAVQVFLDIYKYTLGDPGNMIIPTTEKIMSVDAANYIVRNNPEKFFRSTEEYQRSELFTYIEAIKRIIVNGTNLLSEESDPLHRSLNDLKEDLRRLVNAAKDLIEDYNQYFYMSLVRTLPNIYMAWAVILNNNFLRDLKLQVERDPSDTSTLNLLSAINDIWNHDLVIKEEYEENFDPINDGKWDLYLKTAYDLIISDPHLQYSTSGAHMDNLATLRNSIGGMPETLLKRMIEKYRGTSFAEYLKKF